MSTQEKTLPAKNPSGVLSAGLGLFSMFFGAGNLIFPILIGKSAGQNVWFAIAGLSLTAIVIPFLGLAAMILFQADIHRFFRTIGDLSGRVLLLVMLLILGPLGVIPRLFTLMHATAELFLFEMPLVVFSSLIAILIFACSFRRQKIVGFLGLYFTPPLLLSLALLIFAGIMSPSSAAAPLSSSATEGFMKGLLGGYNMMDLIAALPFATLVFPHFRREIESSDTAQGRRSLLRKMFLSSLIAGGLLLLTYIGLCLVAAQHGNSLDSSISPERMLGTLANQLLGPIGGGMAAIAIMTACLSTAISLAAIFSNYLRVELCRKRIPFPIALIATLAVTISFAGLGFSGIAAFLGPILEIVYPGLILLTLLNLSHSIFGARLVKAPIFVTFAFSAGVSLVNTFS